MNGTLPEDVAKLGPNSHVHAQDNNLLYWLLLRKFCTKLYPTLRMDVMSLRILCWAGLKRHCQFMTKYARDYKKMWFIRLPACRDAPGVSLSLIMLPTHVHTPPNCPLHGVMHTIKFCTPKWHHSQETYP